MLYNIFVARATCNHMHERTLIKFLASTCLTIMHFEGTWHKSLFSIVTSAGIPHTICFCTQPGIQASLPFAQDEKSYKEKRVHGLKAKCKHQKDALDSAKLDIQRLHKTIKTLEVMQLSYGSNQSLLKNLAILT